MSKEDAVEHPKEFPPQKQDSMPGHESEMTPEPMYKAEWYKGSNKLKDKVALITGGDSGIGRSVAILFAREGAKVAISYLNEHEDAHKTKELVEKEEGGECILLPGDIKTKNHCIFLVQETVKHFGKLDILVNNASSQWECQDLREITEEQLLRTYRTNIFSMFFITQVALDHLEKTKGVIINTTSITAFKGHPTLLDYSSTKGAILSFTQSLALNLASKGIRVNCVAPGPIWTPLIPGSFDKEKVKSFGKDTPLGRAGQPEDCSPAFVYLASQDSNYITGQTIHPNGGTIVGG